jgi:hypothetical protein
MRPPSRSRRSGRTVAHVAVVDAGGATLGTGWPPTEPGRRRCLRSGYPARLRERVSDQIGPLIEADRNGSGALCPTLETYLGIGNPAAAARALYIHYNTVKQRMVRIVELLDVDLHDPRTRLSLAVALTARAFDVRCWLARLTARRLHAQVRLLTS